jgi:hypothetical protein
VTTDPDREDEMLTTADDLHLADSIFAGDPLDEAPTRYQPVVDLVRKAQQTPPHHDAPGDAATIAAIIAAVRQRAAAGPERAPRRSRVASRAAVALVATVVFAGAGAAAAATNHLPAAVQSFVSSTAGHLGIDVPTPDDGTVTPTTDAGHPPSDTTTGPPTSQPGASAGASGNDQRPDCAGNPSSDTPGCAVGQPDPTSSKGNDTPGGPPSTKHDNNGNPDPGVPPTTLHLDNSGGVSSDHVHEPKSSSSS